MDVAAASLDVRSGGLVFVFGVLGGVIVLLLAAALVLGRPGWIGAVLGLLAVLYLGHTLIAAESSLVTAGLVGIAILLVGELSQWSFDSRLPGRPAGAMHRARAIGVGGLALLGAGAVLLSLLIIGLPLSGGLITVVVGIGAFVAVAVIISIVARRSTAPVDQ